MRVLSLVLTFLLLFISSHVSSQDQDTQAVAFSTANDLMTPQSRAISLDLGGFGSLSYWMGWVDTARHHGLEYIPGLKRIAFELSLLEVLRSTKEPTLGVNYRNDRWNVIDTNEKNGAQLILGMIPLREYHHSLTLINQYHVKAVVSLLENFEMQPGWYATPVSPKDWRSHGVSHYQIATADFNPLSVEKIRTAINIIQSHWEKGETIYVHCKAGVGRSATVVAAWLALNRLNSGNVSIRDNASLERLVDEIVADMFRIRKINLHAAQKNAVLNYLKSLRSCAKPI